MSEVPSHPQTKPRQFDVMAIDTEGYDLEIVRQLLNTPILFTDNPLVRIHFIIGMVWRTGLAPREFGFAFPGNRVSTFLGWAHPLLLTAFSVICTPTQVYWCTSLIRNSTPP